jgi:hypothetical protein
VCLGPVFVMFLHWREIDRGCDIRPRLRRKESFAGIRIFHWGSRRKTEDLNVTGIRRERTRN